MAMPKVFLSFLVPLAGLAIVAATPAGAQEFGYDCENCPANWGNLSDAFAACIEGEAQSPIAYDEATAQRKRLPRLRPRFGESTLEVERKGTNFESFVEKGSGATRVGRKIFELIQFHFHSTSEHVVNGERFPLEMHFVHQAADGALAVLALFIVEGDNLDALDPLIDALPAVVMTGAGGVVNVPAIDVAELLPRTRKSFRYRGSTTTPPCTGGVSWIILARTLELSGGQIEAIQDALLEINNGIDNNRPIQIRNGRVVMTDVPRDDGKDGDDD